MSFFIETPIVIDLGDKFIGLLFMKVMIFADLKV